MFKTNKTTFACVKSREKIKKTSFLKFNENFKLLRVSKGKSRVSQNKCLQ